MVSRGGRSKGCSHCRRRRIKCDEKQPTCSQCLKRGLNCGGPKDLTWIYNFPANQNTKQAPKIPIVESNLITEISLVAFEQTACLAFARKHLIRRGGLLELAFRMIDVSDSSARFAGDSGLELLRKSLSSLSVVFFGIKHHQDQMKRKGYTQYGEVLKQLNHHLAQPEWQLADETVLTASSCMLLEIFLPTGPTNFLKHQRGIDAMMELRGPPTESAGTAFEIFRGVRILSILGALADSRPSFYSKHEWKRIPPAQNNEAALLHRRIFDVLADCTHLKSQRDSLLTLGATPETTHSFLIQAQDVLDDLTALYPLWEDLNRSQLVIVKSQSESAKELGVANDVSATAYMLYHTAYMCILQIKDSISPSPDHMTLRNNSALKIAKCLELREYEQRTRAPESNTIGFVATRVAWHALGGFDSPEGQRLAHIVNSTVNNNLRHLGESHQEHVQNGTSMLDRTPVGIAQLPNPDYPFKDDAVINLWDVSLDLFNLDFKKVR